MSSLSRTPVLFLGGLGRSGTTLLERLLGQVAGMQPLGESVHLWMRGVRDNERCGCGQAFSDCEWWRSVGDKAFGGWSNVDVAEVTRLRRKVDRLRNVPAIAMSDSDDLREYRSFYAKVYAAAEELSGARCLIDSSKHPSLAHCLRRDPTVDLRVVHVVRHPCAVANAWTKQVKRPDVTADQTSNEFMIRYTPERTAALWNGENLALESLRTLGVPVHRVRYEDLAADPARTLAEVLNFAGVDDDVSAVMDGNRASLGVAHTVSGNPIRFTTGPVTIQLDEAWHSQFSSRDQGRVKALTWPVARHYGYFKGHDHVG
jgi:hypothetical protein